MNTLTDSLNMVTPEEKPRTFNLFRRKRAEKYGFALAVFRKQALLGLIPSSDISVESDITRSYSRLGVKDGDIILSINLGPQRLKISETLPTKDNWPRLFQLELDIVVTNLIQFAQRYIQQSDPVAWAKTAIEGHIQSTAGFWEHDEITEPMLRAWAQESLSLPKNTTSGLSVMAVHKAFLPMNPDRGRKVGLERKRELDQFEIETEGAIQRSREQERINRELLNEQGQQDLVRLRAEEQRKEREMEAEFLRAEESKQATHSNSQQLIDLDEQARRQQKSFFLQTQDVDQQLAIETRRKRHEYDLLIEEASQISHRHKIEEQNVRHQLAIEGQKWESQVRQKWIERLGEEGTMPGLIARIQEQLSDDKSSLSGAVSEPELQYLLDILSGGPGSGPRLLAQPVAQEQSPQNKVSPVAEPSSSQSAVTGQFRPVFAGVIQQTEEAVEIPDLGLRLIQTTLSKKQSDLAGLGIGYIIYLLNPHGPAQQADLQVADIIIDIDDEEITNIQAISQAVSKKDSDSELILHVLRGRDLKEIRIKPVR